MSVNVPSGYKQTKVGVIPEDWDVVKLGEIFYEIKDKVGTENIETYSISASVGFVSQKKRFGKDISGAQNKNYIVLKKNQFAYNKGNSKSYKYGCVYPNTTNKLIAVPNVFISFDFRDEGMSTQYYAKLFEHHFLDRGLRRIISSSARMDGLLNINKKYFFELPIHVPPKEEQQKIAQILTTWDDAISKQETLTKAKEELKKGLMQKLLSGEFRFDGFDGEWETNKLKDITKVNQGLQIPISKRFLEDGDNRYFYITVKFLKENSKDKYFIENPHQSVICTEEDILMTRTGSTGMVITNVSGAFHNNFFKIKFNEDKLFRDFLFYFLNYDHTQFLLKTYAGTTTIPDLTHSDFYSIKIKLPPKEEQQKIAEVLTHVDKEIDLLKNELEALKEQKRGLMQRLLSGEVRVMV